MREVLASWLSILESLLFTVLATKQPGSSNAAPETDKTRTKEEIFTPNDVLCRDVIPIANFILERNLNLLTTPIGHDKPLPRFISILGIRQQLPYQDTELRPIDIIHGIGGLISIGFNLYQPIDIPLSNHNLQGERIVVFSDPRRND